MDGSTSDIDWNKEAVSYLKQLQLTGFQYGIFVADSKLVTHDLVCSMNSLENHVPFISRCPASFYYSQSFIEEVCGQPMRLLVLESSSLQGKASLAINKAQEALKPAGLKLFECNFEIEKAVKEKWPRGRRSAAAKPVLYEEYRIHVTEIRQNKERCKEFLQNESCIVLISNVVEGNSSRDLLEIYKGQQVVENSFRLPLSMLLTFSLLIRAIIQYRLREGLKTYEAENPGAKLKAGWGNRPLKNPTYQLLHEHACNCYFEKEKMEEYSFAWPTVETKTRVTVLLMLFGVELAALIK